MLATCESEALKDPWHQDDNTQFGDMCFPPPLLPSLLFFFSFPFFFLTCEYIQTNQIMKKAGSVSGCRLDNKLLSIMDNQSHPPHHKLNRFLQESETAALSERMLPSSVELWPYITLPCCGTDSILNIFPGLRRWFKKPYLSLPLPFPHLCCTYCRLIWLVL